MISKSYQSKRKIKSALLGILCMACIFESWAIVYTTEYDFEGISFCELDTEIADYGIFKWIVLTEALVSYAIPFAITIAADLLVLCRSYAAGLFTIITTDELSTKNSMGGGDAAKILPKNYRQKRLRQKHRSILRCILAASLDIGLNFPDYILQLLDNFVPLRELLSSYQLHYGLEAFAYILYTFQYPLIILYVRLILKDFGGGSTYSSAGSTVNVIRSEILNHANMSVGRSSSAIQGTKN